MASEISVENQGVISSVEIPFLHVEWKILYSLLQLQNTEHAIESPSFHFKDTAWHFRVTVKDCIPYKVIHIYLVRKDCVTQTPAVYSQLEIKEANGKMYNSHCFNCIVFRQQISSALGDIVLCSQHLTCDKDVLAPKGVMTVICNFFLEPSGNFKTDSKMELSKAMQLGSQTMPTPFPLPSCTTPVLQFGEKTYLSKNNGYSTPALPSTRATSIFGSVLSDNSSKCDSVTSSEISKTPIVSSRLQSALKTNDNQIPKSTTPVPQCGEKTDLSKNNGYSTPSLPSTSATSIFGSVLSDNSLKLDSVSSSEASKTTVVSSGLQFALKTNDNQTAKSASPVLPFGVNSADLSKTNGYSTPAFPSTSATSVFGSAFSDNSTKFGFVTSSEASKTPVVLSKLQSSLTSDDNQIAKSTAPVQFGEKLDLYKTSAYSAPALPSTSATTTTVFSSVFSDNSSKFNFVTSSDSSKTAVVSSKLQPALKMNDNQIAESTTPAVFSVANSSANFDFSFTPSIIFSQFNSAFSLSSSSNEVPYKSDGMAKFIMDMKNLLNSGEDSDVTFKVKDKEFKAHKSIIRARSSVFYAMFSHDMWEKNNGGVDITDCEPEAFKMFLLYLYNGSVENLSTSTIFDLYRMADKYDIKELKFSSTKFMMCNISLSNLCDVIEHALQYKESELLEAATIFFSKNFKDVILTVKWQCFLKKNPVEANELLIIYSKGGACMPKRKDKDKKKSSLFYQEKQI